MSAATVQIADHCVDRFSELVQCSEQRHHAWIDEKVRAKSALGDMEWYLTSVHVLSNETIALLCKLDADDGLSRAAIVLRSRLAMTEIADRIHAVIIGEIERVSELYLVR